MRETRQYFNRVLVLLTLTAGALVLSPHSLCESAMKAYKAGRSAEQAGDDISAYTDFKKALNQQPGDIRFRAAYERSRNAAAAEYLKRGEKAAGSGNMTVALTSFLNALDVDPSNEVADGDVRALEARLRAHDQDKESTSVSEFAKGAPPLALDIRGSESVSLHMAEDSKVVYRALTTSAGLNVVFDPDYISKRIEVDLRDVSVADALEVLQQISNTFWKPITKNTIFVAQDSHAKRVALGQQAVQIFYLKNVSQQNDLNDVQTALRNVLPSAKLYGVATQNAIVMRGTPDEIALGGILISGLDQPRPEVLVDISVMEVDRDKLRKIGLSPPTSLTVSSGSSQTLNDIGKTSSYSISVGQAAVQFLLTDSQTRILQSPSLRALDGQKATLKLGERLPIATGTYTVGTGSSSSAAETQFQYIDVGVNVEMTPAIHGDHDITLKLSVEVSSQSGTETIDGVSEPIISQQKADQMIRLKDGEATLMAGLLKSQDSRSVSGWPGFGDIAVAKYFFTTQSHEVVDEELVFLIVPHVVRVPNSTAYFKEQIDTGTESQIQLRAKPHSADAALPKGPQ